MNFLRGLKNYVSGFFKPRVDPAKQKEEAKYKREVRRTLARLKGVEVGSLTYPSTKEKLQEYEAEIEQNREDITNEEADRIRQIDPHPHYEIVFNRREQVRVGREITDSNFIADIAIGTPNEYDYSALLIGTSAEIERIMQDELQRLGPIKVRLGIFVTMRRLVNWQKYLFKEHIPDENDKYEYRYHIPIKTRNLVILLATNINDIFNFGLMRITEKVDSYQHYG